MAKTELLIGGSLLAAAFLLPKTKAKQIGGSGGGGIARIPIGFTETAAPRGKRGSSIFNIDIPKEDLSGLMKSTGTETKKQAKSPTSQNQFFRTAGNGKTESGTFTSLKDVEGLSPSEALEKFAKPTGEIPKGREGKPITDVFEPTKKERKKETGGGFFDNVIKLIPRFIF